MLPNPLAPVTDYQSMLNRIFWFTSASALAAIWLLRLDIPALDSSLSKVDLALALGGDKGLPTPGGYLLPALAVGIATRVFRLHARISDWLGIRECFDVEVVIGELAEQLGIDLKVVGEAQLRAARPSLMRRAFYLFVSTSRPQIDRQLVEQALDAWSWFWIALEATALFTLTGFCLIMGSAYKTGFQTLGGALLMAVFVLPAIRRQCKRYAVAQVRAILADRTRATAVQSAFEEVIGVKINRRRAA